MVATSDSPVRKLDLVPARVDVDDGVRRPEVLGPPAHLGVADPVEPAGHRRDRRDVDGLLGHRLVGDRPLEVDVDRLGDADHRAVDRIERRRQEHRLPDERRRVLPGGRALRDRQGRARQRVSRRERVGRRGWRWWSRKRIGRRLRRRQFGRCGGGGGGGAAAHRVGAAARRVGVAARAPRPGRPAPAVVAVARVAPAQTGHLTPVRQPARPRKSRRPVSPSSLAAYVTSSQKLRPVSHSTGASYRPRGPLRPDDRPTK